MAVFLLWREIFITTGKIKRFITTGKKKRCSRLWREISIFFVVAEILITTGKKKDTVVCWREIGSFFVVAGNFYYDWKKKKIQSSVWRVRGSGDYDRNKKRFSRLSVGCAVLAIMTGKKKDTVVCLAGCAVVLCQFLVLAGN